MGGLRLCITRPKTTSWTFRPSYAARRTEVFALVMQPRAETIGAGLFIL